MNKSPKFRAWHKTEKKMGRVKVLNLDKGAFVEGLLPDEGSYDEENRIYSVPSGDGRFCEFNEIILMEYTGKQSIDGIEVYDGDILAFPNDSDHLYYIHWSNEEGGWGIYYRGMLVFKIGILPQMKIIGDIHTSPKLVKDR